MNRRTVGARRFDWTNDRKSDRNTMNRTSSSESTTSNVVASSRFHVNIVPSRGHYNRKILRSAIITGSGTLMVTGFQWLSTHQIKLLQLCFALVASVAAARIAYTQQKKHDEFRGVIEKLLSESAPAGHCVCSSDCRCDCSSARTPDCGQQVP